MKLNVYLENHSYPIYIERNAIQKVHEYIPVSRKIAIITDTGVPEKWVNIVKEQCPDSFICTIPQGEPSKCFDQYKNLLEDMISHNMSRKDAIIAVGGGVVGDLAGFVAASYMRGIDFYNIPTTVLSQVDSSVGGASATGLGEDLMKGCISYEIVRLMAEGMHPQAACEKAVNQLDHRLKERRGHAGDLSLIAMNNKGEWGVATNIEGFSFAVATENQEPIVYLTKNKDGKCIHEVASQEWLDHYMKTRMAPLEEK